MLGSCSRLARARALPADAWSRLPARVVLIEMNIRRTPQARLDQVERVLARKAGMCLFGTSGHGNQVWVDPDYDQKVRV